MEKRAGALILADVDVSVENPERLRTERTMRPFEEQKLSLSHVRYFVFSPHITHRADRD